MPVHVEGLRELQRALAKGDKETKKQVRATLKESGEVVRIPWRTDEERFGNRTASGLRVSVRQSGISVEQGRRKSSVRARRRPNFGPKQQKIGETILARHEREIERDFELAMDKVALIIGGIG